MKFKTLVLITAIIEFIASAILACVGIASFIDARDAIMRSNFILFGIGCITLALMWAGIGLMNIKIYKEEEE